MNILWQIFYAIGPVFIAVYGRTRYLVTLVVALEHKYLRPKFSTRNAKITKRHQKFEPSLNSVSILTGACQDLFRPVQSQQIMSSSFPDKAKKSLFKYGWKLVQTNEMLV